MRRLSSAGLGVGLLVVGILLPVGCVRPRSAPEATATSSAATRVPTGAVPSATATRSGQAVVVPTAPATFSVPATTVPTVGVTPTATLPAATSTPVPVQTPQATLAPTPSQGEVTYEVRWGDTLATIAQQFGTTPEAILRRNPRISDRNQVPAGTVLVIPTGTGQTVPAVTPQATAAAQTGPTVYVVKRGDSLSVIARRYGTTVDAILRANPSITNRNRIYTGQRLVIPVDGSGSQPTSGVRTHVVRRGDTLTALARQYNTTVWAIVVRNNLRNANLIYTGQVLIIP